MVTVICTYQKTRLHVSIICTTGSSSQVLRHCGHLLGFESFSVEKTKPHLRHSAGVTSSRYTDCLSVLRRCLTSSSTSLRGTSYRRAISESRRGLSSNNVIRSFLNIRSVPSLCPGL